MSRYQKIMSALSVIVIVAGTVAVIFGVLGALGFGYAATSAEIHNEIEGYTPALGRSLILGMVLLALSGVFNVILGVSGLAAARNARWVKPVCILSGLSLVVGVVQLVNSAVSGRITFTDIAGLIMPALMLWCAFKVKQQRDADV